MKIDLPRIENFMGDEVPTFGYELLRSVLIPDLLGDEIGAILYWSGRKLARSYPCETIDDIVDFFEKAVWGTLVMKEETRGKIEFECRSELIAARMKYDPVFSLEGGFLAEQIQTLKGYIAETYTEVKNGRDKKVTFQIKWDLRDKI